MPKRSNKHVGDDYESDDGFVEDAPKSKKQKKELSSGMQRDDDGNEYWELSGKRRLQISDFKGSILVGVREFYEKDGKTLPGKKGISLSMDQYKAFIALLPEIERVLGSKGIQVPRPKYDGAPIDGVEEEAGDGEMKESSIVKQSKANHEATSDEEE